MKKFNEVAAAPFSRLAAPFPHHFRTCYFLPSCCLTIWNFLKKWRRHPDLNRAPKSEPAEITANKPRLFGPAPFPHHRYTKSWANRPPQKYNRQNVDKPETENEIFNDTELN